MKNPSSKMLYAYLEEKYPEYLICNSIKWNCTKFLIDKNGNVVSRFEPTAEPMDMIEHIEKLL